MFQFLSPPVDNMNALLRILTAIDTAPTKLSEPSIDKLSHVLPKYLLDVASVSIKYYLLPSILFSPVLPTHDTK